MLLQSATYIDQELFLHIVHVNEMFYPDMYKQRNPFICCKTNFVFCDTYANRPFFFKH